MNPIQLQRVPLPDPPEKGSSGILRNIEHALSKNDAGNAHLFFSQLIGEGRINEACQIYFRWADVGNLTAENILCSEFFDNTDFLEQKFDCCLDLAVGHCSPSALYILGKMYHRGIYATPNLTTAVLCYQKAAEYKHPHATCDMGNAYYCGMGVKQDYKKAYDCFKVAASARIPIAFFSLGFLYQRGHGVLQDTSLAQRYFRAAYIRGVQVAREEIIPGYRWQATSLI